MNSLSRNPGSAMQKCAALLVAGALLLSLSFSGCQKKNTIAAKPQPTVTIENLQLAYGKAVKYKEMYGQFATQAEKEGLKTLAALYRAASLSEGVHASNHAMLLRSHGNEPLQPAPEPIVVGKALQSLKKGLSSEEIETGSLYPSLIQTAGAEQYPVAVEQFKRCCEADARQAELFKASLDKLGRIPKTQYMVCRGCGYIITFEKTDECPACKARRDAFQKI